jgi:hypothetical protein
VGSPASHAQGHPDDPGDWLLQALDFEPSIASDEQGLLRNVVRIRPNPGSNRQCDSIEASRIEADIPVVGRGHAGDGIRIALRGNRFGARLTRILVNAAMCVAT